MVNGHHHARAALTPGKFPSTRGIVCWVGPSVLLEEQVALDGLLSVTGTEIPAQPWTGPEVSRRLGIPDFKTVDS